MTKFGLETYLDHGLLDGRTTSKTSTEHSSDSGSSAHAWSVLETCSICLCHGDTTSSINSTEHSVASGAAHAESAFATDASCRCAAEITSIISTEHSTESGSTHAASAVASDGGGGASAVAVPAAAPYSLEGDARHTEPAAWRRERCGQIRPPTRRRALIGSKREATSVASNAQRGFIAALAQRDLNSRP